MGRAVGSIARQDNERIVEITLRFIIAMNLQFLTKKKKKKQINRRGRVASLNRGRRGVESCLETQPLNQSSKSVIAIKVLPFERRIRKNPRRIFSFFSLAIFFLAIFSNRFSVACLNLSSQSFSLLIV